MLKLVVSVFALICISSCLAERTAKLAVIRSPSVHKYSYDQDSRLKLSDFKNFLLSANGFSIDKPVEWKGLQSTNSLVFPRATIVFLVDNKNFNINTFSDKVVSVDEDTTLDFNYLKESTANSDSSVKLYDHLPNEEELKNIDCSHASNFYVIRYDQDTDQLAKNVDSVLKQFLEPTCVQDKDSELLVYLLSTNEQQRVKRQAAKVKQQQSNKASKIEVKQEQVKISNEDKHVAKQAEFYSDQYPAMFNLLFWTSLILALAVFMITYSMWSMDPGLDTVIYRMTSQRIKKDQ